MIQQIAINNDPNRVITFDPADKLFAEKFYRMIDHINQRLSERVGKGKEFSADEETKHVHAQIDSVFGVGTAQKVFGDPHSLNLSVLQQFCRGMEQLIPEPKQK